MKNQPMKIAIMEKVIISPAIKDVSGKVVKEETKKKERMEVDDMHRRAWEIEGWKFIQYKNDAKKVEVSNV